MTPEQLVEAMLEVTNPGIGPEHPTEIVILNHMRASLLPTIRAYTKKVFLQAYDQGFADGYDSGYREAQEQVSEWNKPDR
jgi:flagellar biosynthesis/type III secretory pathway protein FliH